MPQNLSQLMVRKLGLYQSAVGSGPPLEECKVPGTGM